MAKMFYSLEEAAQKLDKSPDEVRAMAERNELNEFRDGDKLIYKVDQVDLLTDDHGGGDQVGESDLSGMISLQDTGGTNALGLEETGGSMVGLADSSAQAGSEKPVEASETVPMGDSGGGITVLDDEELGGADASADTLVTDEPGLDNVNLESFGSGSGLMDLTRESDDTSLGLGNEGLMDELYSGGDAGSSETATAAGDDLFEGSPSAEEFGGGGGQPMAVAAAPMAYDGKGSGLAFGLALGMVIALVAALAVVAMSLMGGLPPLGETLNVADQGLLIPIAALLVLTLVFGAIGFVLGGRK